VGGALPLQHRLERAIRIHVDGHQPAVLRHFGQQPIRDGLNYSRPRSDGAIRARRQRRGSGGLSGREGGRSGGGCGSACSARDAARRCVALVAGCTRAAATGAAAGSAVVMVTVMVTTAAAATSSRIRVQDGGCGGSGSGGCCSGCGGALCTRLGYDSGSA
jgi:hypothetical protein